MGGLRDGGPRQVLRHYAAPMKRNSSVSLR